jgi:hypothetical protein
MQDSLSKKQDGYSDTNARQCTLNKVDHIARLKARYVQLQQTHIFPPKSPSRSKQYEPPHTFSLLSIRNCHWVVIAYKKAANMAPAKPRAAPPALICAAAPAELDDLAPVPVAVPLAPLADPDAAAPEPEAAAVDEALRIEVMDPDMETVTVELPYGTVFKPVERPAGKVATAGWEVMTEG